jgi:hypothetical protein
MSLLVIRDPRWAAPGRAAEHWREMGLSAAALDAVDHGVSLTHVSVKIVEDRSEAELFDVGIGPCGHAIWHFLSFLGLNGQTQLTV